jgi:DUF1365 family protein
VIPNSDGALYLGRVMHARLNPFRHRFQYRVFSLWLDIDRVAKTTSQLTLLTYNRFGLLSFYDRDHGARDGSKLRPWVERSLRTAGVSPPGGAIRLLCFPRVLGHVFNPLSIYFCYDSHNRLRASVYEVRNTFGELHVYVADALENERGEIAQSAAKSFYVSPLIQMDARYDFGLKAPDEHLSFSIRQSGPDGPLLLATHQGRRVPLTDWRLAMAFLIHPLLTMKVVAAIHFQALKLFLKGARYHPHRPHSGPQITRADGIKRTAPREAA